MKRSGKFVIHLGKLGFTCSGDHGRASQVALVVKNPPADAGGVRDVCVQSLGWQDPLEEGMATHCSVLAWRVPVN